MSSFKFTILGSNSALPSAGRHPSAHILNVHEQHYLIDAGEAVQSQIKRYGFNAHKIDHIFITHLHGDHCYGIFGLISTLGLLKREKELHIYAPSPIEEIILNHLRLFECYLPYKVVCHTFNHKQSELIYENKVLAVHTIPLKHRVNCCGFLFREKIPPLNVHKESIEKFGLGIAQIASAKRGEDIVMPDGEVISNSVITYQPYIPRSFAYCTDTAYSERVVEMVAKVDLLYHESTFLSEDKHMAKKTGHSTALDAANVAIKAGVKQLLIGHFSHRYDSRDILFEEEAKQVFENTFTAIEGKTFVIPLNKKN